MKKKVAVLGATGSIGKSTLDILRNNKDRFSPVLFSAHNNSRELLELKKEFPGALTALSAAPVKSGGGIKNSGIDFTGEQGLLDAIAASGAQITVNGISGAAGLLPSEAVLKSGSDLALANKETVVMAGNIIFSLAEKKNARIIPVDSEHSALFKLIQAHRKENVCEIILTASGGPFRNHSMEMLSQVKPQQALTHPVWDMGPKISVDSATMANKGLELIEAAVFFNFPMEHIKVVIHPQSVIHSMIRLKNGAIYAQMSKPDMRLPIHEALCWPETEHADYGALDLDSLYLSFEKPDPDRFPMLALDYEALRGGPLLPAIYNAANERAVQAFCEGRIGFLEIPRIVGYVIHQSKSWPHINREFPGPDGSAGIHTVLDIDKKARELAGTLIT